MNLRPAHLPILALLLAAPAAAAQEGAPATRGDPTGALLRSPSPACLEALGKALRKLSTYLTAEEIPGDLFTRAPHATLRTEKDRTGKPRAYEFNLWIDHYDQACRVTMKDWASSLLPECTCVHVDPVAAAEPYGHHLRQLVDAGRVKALEQACAKSAHPLSAQAAEYRKTNTEYVEFKIRLPALMERARQKPGQQEKNDALDFTLAKADLERGVVSEKAYGDQLKALQGVPRTELDTACKGANNLLVEKTMGMVFEMKTFATVNGVSLDQK